DRGYAGRTPPGPRPSSQTTCHGSLTPFYVHGPAPTQPPALPLRDVFPSSWCRLLAFGAAFAPPQKVRRSHDGDLISVWKGDRSEPTTLRATARRCLDPFHDPPKPRRLLATMSRKSFLTSTRPLRVLGEVRHRRGKTSRREAQPAGHLPAVSRPLPRPPACTKASPTPCLHQRKPLQASLQTVSLTSVLTSNRTERGSSATKSAQIS